MIERSVIEAGQAKALHADITQLNDGRVLRIILLRGGTPLTWFDVVDGWRNDPLFRSFFGSILVDAPFRAYFWETPPVTRATIKRDFEFVLVDSPQLAGIHTDQRAFANQFATAQAAAPVIEFANLGGDATLVVPCQRGPFSAYSQISEFARTAPEDQQHQLWQMVGTTFERQLGVQPIWISTSGLGVYWVHIRFDTNPKYYTHAAYRSM